MMGGNFKYTHFVFHELKYAITTSLGLLLWPELFAVSVCTSSHRQPVQLRGQTPIKATCSRSMWAWAGEEASSTERPMEGGVPAWVSAMVTTAQ